MQDRQGENEPTFESFYKETHARVVASLTLTLGDVEVARDAAADAFTKALVNWQRVSRMSSPVGWTYTVAMNSGRRFFTRRATERRLLEAHGQARAELPDEVATVWLDLKRLPLRQREAVVLRYALDMTEVQVASAMGVRRSTVSATLAAARRSLGSLLADTTDVPLLEGRTR